MPFESPDVVPQTVGRSNRLAFGAGVLALVLSITVGILALNRSHSELLARSHEAAVHGVQARLTLVDSLPGSTLDAAALLGLQHNFEELRRFETSQLVVLDRDERILLHTGHPELVGASWATLSLEQVGAPTRELREILSQPLPWSDEVRIDGEGCIVAIGTSPSKGITLLTLTPTADVDAAVHAATLPWWIALGLITLVLIPLPLVLLHRSSRQALAAEEAARLRAESSESALSAALESLPFEVWVQDLDGRVRMQNATDLRANGRMVGKTVPELGYPPDVEAFWSTNHRRATLGETVETQFERVIDGQQRHFHSVLAPVRTERGITGVTGVNIDVTRLRSVERELQLALQRLDAHVDNSPLALIEWDRNLRVVRWSDGAERIFGWSSADVVGRSPNDGLEFLSEAETAVSDAFERMRSSGVDRVVHEARVRTKQGRTLQCTWHDSLLRDEKGELVSVVSLVQDVSAQKLASDLQKIQEHLLRRILGGVSESTFLQEVLESIQAQIPEAQGSILLVEQDGQHLRTACALGLAPEFCALVDGLEIGPESGACGAAAWFKERIVCADVETDPRTRTFRDVLARFGLRAIWSQPILSPERDVLGTFALYLTAPGEPNRSYLEIMETAASLTGLALSRRNTRWIEDTQREILRGILDEKPIELILEVLASGIQRQVPGMIAGVLLRDVDGVRLHPAAGPSFPEEVLTALDGLMIDPTGGTCGRASYTKELCISEDFETDPLMASFWPLLSKYGMRSGWSQPILNGEGEVLGTFAMYWRQRRRPSAREHQLLEMATSLAALAIERSLAQGVAATHQQVMRLVIDEAPIEDTLSALLQGMERQMLGMRGAALSKSANGRRLDFAAGPSLSRDFVRAVDGVEVVAGGCPCGNACATRERTIVRDVQESPLTRNILGLFEGEGIRAAWSNPVVSVRGDVLGSVSMYWREPREPSPRESMLLDFAASMAGIVLEHARVEDERLRLTERLETLHEIGRAILASDTIEGIAGAAVDRVLTQIQCTRVSVTVFDLEPGPGRLIAVASRKPHHFHVGGKSGTQFLAARETSRLAAGLLATVPDLRPLVRDLPEVADLVEEGVLAIVFAPLVLHGRLLGTLSIGLDRTGDLPEAEGDFLREVGDMLALAMEQLRLHERERDLTTRLSTINDIGRRILEVRSAAGIALTSVERIHQAIECQRASVILFDDAATRYEVVAAVTKVPSRLSAGRTGPLAEMHFGSIADLRAGHAWCVEDIREHSPCISTLQDLLDESIFSYTATPMVLQGELLGVLCIGRDRPSRLEPVELDFLREVADLLAIGLRQVRLDEELHSRAEEQRRLSERLATLNRIGGAILHSRTSAELLASVLAATRSSITCRRASVLLLDEQSRVLTLAGIDSEYTSRARPGAMIPLELVPADILAAVRRNEVLRITDLEPHRSVVPQVDELVREGIRSVVVIPMLSQGQVLGALNLWSATHEGISDGECELGREIAGLLAVGLVQLRLHEKVRRNAEELEQRVLERTAELTEVNEELESYVRTVSHDLRAPLRAIQGLGTAVIEDYGERLDVQGMDYLARMTAAAERMDRMLLDLLAYSRMGKTEIVLEPIATEDVVREARNLVHAVLDGSNAVIEVERPLLPMLGHRPTLLQVVSNLLTNAAKFVRPGKTPRIRLRTERSGSNVRLWVDDEGIGIAPEHQERIFRAFERLHPHDEYPGTGIGLAIVRRATERMGGRAGVESRLGEGSHFWIELPSATDRP